jgi:hypothetical protein
MLVLQDLREDLLGVTAQGREGRCGNEPVLKLAQDLLGLFRPQGGVEKLFHLLGAGTENAGTLLQHFPEILVDHVQLLSRDVLPADLVHGFADGDDVVFPEVLQDPGRRIAVDVQQEGGDFLSS